MLYCGAGEKNITPGIGMGIPGYFGNRKNTGVTDELFAKALVFEKDGTACAIVVCDTINLERQDVLRIRKGISERIPIDPENISVSATHTHTGGPTWEGFNIVLRDYAYIDMLTGAAVDAACDAYNKRKPAKIGFNTDELKGYTHIRRFWMKDGRVLTNPGMDNPDIVKPEGEPDYTLTYARIEGPDGEVIAFLTSYGVHLDTVGGNKISADYPGVLSKLIKEKYGKNTVSVFLTGPCGNTNHIDVKRPETLEYGIHVKIGEAIFQKIRDGEHDIKFMEDPEISVDTKRFLIRFNRPDEGQLRWARNVLDGKPAETDGYEVSSPERMRIFAKAIIDASESREQVSEVELKAIHIGDALIVSWPGEIFVDFGIELRKRLSGRHVIIGELSNGCIQNYIPTFEAYERGGYEPRICCATNPEKNTGNLVLKNTLEMLKII